VPKVRVFRDKLYRDVLLSIAGAPDRNRFAIHFLSRDFIFELQNLAQHNFEIQLDGCTMQAHGVRKSLHGKSLANFGLPANAQRYGQHHPHGATALFTAKVKYCHGDSYLIIGRRSEHGRTDFDALPAINRRKKNQVCEQNAEVTR